jgi:hypothetical protein
LNSKKQIACLRLLVRWLAAATTLVYVFLSFLPRLSPRHDSLIDDSWVQVLHLAFIQHLQFGRDIVFTLGPWGFLYWGCHPATFLTSVIVWAVLALVFWWAAWNVSRHIFSNELIAWFWLLAFISVTDITIYPNIDVRLMAWALLLLLMHFFVDDRPFTVIQALLVVSLALLGLVKFSTLVLAVVIVLAVAADNVLRQRRFPWTLPVFGAGLLFFWMLAGQDLSAFGPFVGNSWRVANGFTEAMALTRAEELRDVFGFLVAAGLLLGLAGCAAWRRHRFFGIIPLAGLGFAAFAAFKYGYVRHDGHEVTATLQLLLMALVCLALLWPVARKKGLWAVVANLLPTTAIYFFAAATFDRYADVGIPSVIARTSSFRKLPALAQLLHPNAQQREAYEQYLADFRNRFPLPHIQGSVDTYPWNQAEILAYGFAYQPRPVIQSYTAYTPELAKLNAAHLRSDRAPANILFENWPVDDHYPSLDDGLSWPELLTRYEVQDAECRFVLLKRSASPREFHLTLLRDRLVKFGDEVAVDSETNALLWAEIDVQPTLLGAVVSTLYKPPILSLAVSLRDGRQLRQRLVPGMARSGFLLSPLIEDCAGFALLTSVDGTQELAGSKVTSLSIAGAGESSPTAGYRDAVRIRFYRLEFPRQDLEPATGFRQLVNLQKTLRRAEWRQTDDPPQLIYAPAIGSVLAVAPDSSIRVPVPAPLKRLKLGFGIYRSGEAAQSPANQVVFQVSSLDEHGQPVSLWSRRLDAVNCEADRGPQQALIDLSACQQTNVMLETLRGDSMPTDGNLNYWSAINFE